MSNIVKYTINMDSEFHKNLKVFSTLKGVNMKDYIISLIKKDMKKNNMCVYGYSHKLNQETKKALQNNNPETKLDSIKDIWSD